MLLNTALTSNGNIQRGIETAIKLVYISLHLVAVAIDLEDILENMSSSFVYSSFLGNLRFSRLFSRDTIYLYKNRDTLRLNMNVQNKGESLSGGGKG